MQVALSASVLVDAMGSFSPIAAQARKGRKPDSVVVMVGSCARGLPERAGADLLYSFVPINKCASLVALSTPRSRPLSSITGTLPFLTASWLHFSEQTRTMQGAAAPVLLGGFPSAGWGHHIHVRIH